MLAQPSSPDPVTWAAELGSRTEILTAVQIFDRKGIRRPQRIGSLCPIAAQPNRRHRGRWTVGDFLIQMPPAIVSGLEQDVESKPFASRQQKLLDALNAMENALLLLDEADCSADIGAHLDLAICRLKDLLPNDHSSLTPPRAASEKIQK